MKQVYSNHHINFKFMKYVIAIIIWLVIFSFICFLNECISEGLLEDIISWVIGGILATLPALASLED
jgi:uncharacterized membrane-anchored protein